MFCIAAFIVLVIISIFSAKYRRMAKRAWGCVARRMTFRPCDTRFKDELKSRLLARVAVKKPRLLKLSNIGIEIAAFLIVFLTVWSLYVVAKSGLNLYVYGTCNPANAASCSLGAESCSIDTVKPSLYTSVKEFKVHSWVANEVSGLGETIAAVPTRIQNWQAEKYLPATASYETKFDENKPTALDIFDPGCQYCQQLYLNQRDAKFSSNYNVTYIAYPIKDTTTKTGYKFKNSLVVTKYLEAIKLHPLEGEATPADWQILDKIFATKDGGGVSYQIKFNMMLSADQAEEQLVIWLKEIGYSDQQVAEISKETSSSKVAQTIETNRKVVEDQIKTVKIPTLIFDGKRHSGVVKTENLR